MAIAMMPATGWLFITAEDSAAVNPVAKLAASALTPWAPRSSRPTRSVSPAARRPCAIRNMPTTNRITSHAIPRATSTTRSPAHR